MKEFTLNFIFYSLIVVILFCLVLCDVDNHDSLRVIALMLMGTLILYHPLKAVMLKRLDYFEPINIFLLTFALGFFFPAFFLLNDGHRAYEFVNINLNLFGSALIMSSVSLMFFIIGYDLCGIKTKTIQKHRELVKYNSKTIIWILYGLLFIYFLAVITQRLLLGERTVRGLGYEYGYGFFQPFTALGFFIPLAYYVLLYTERKKLTFLGIICIGLVLYSFISSGSRGGVLSSLMGLIIYRHYLIKKVSGFFLGLMFLIALFLVIYVGIYRFNAFTTFDFTLMREHFQGIFLTTFAGLESLIAVISQVPNNIPFYNGLLFLEVNTYPLLPRFIFSKPEVYGYDRFWESYIHSVTGSKTQMFVSMPGSFYLDFGMFGIIVGSLIWGYTFKFIYLYFLRNQHRRVIILLYGIFIITVVQSAPFALFSVYSFLLNFAIPIIVIKLIERKKKKQYVWNYRDSLPNPR